MPVPTDDALHLVDHIKSLVEAMPGFGWAAWANGDFIWQSRGMAAHTGLSQEEYVGRDTDGEFQWSKLLHPQDYARLSKAWMAAVDRREDFSVTHLVKTASGEFRWLKSTAKAQKDAAGEVIYWLGTSIDIHEAVVAMEASKASEKLLREIIDAVPAPIWSVDETGRPIYFNQTLVRQVGIEIDHENKNERSLEAVTSKVVFSEDFERVVGALRKAFSTGEPLKEKYRQRRENGEYRWTTVQAAPLRDEEGRIIRWLGVTVDIDEEISAHAAVLEREARLVLMIETIPGLVWVSNPAGNPTYFSKQLEEWSGLKIDDLGSADGDTLAAIIMKTIHPEDQALVETSIRQSFSSGQPWALKFRQRRSDGVWRWLEARMEPLRDASGAIVQWFGLQLDIDNEVRTQDALRLAQEKLAQAAQFAGMAELSASIAHEVSQPLASISMSADAARRWLDMEPPNIQRAQLSAEAVLRDAGIASDVVKRIRALFQHSSEEREAGCINALVETARDLMADALTQKGTRIRLVLDRGLPGAFLDSIQIQQVLVNLIRNACEAMSDGACSKRLITISTELIDEDIRVQVKDTGPGIRAPEKIFAPFYTTKESGMGIGLSICQSIVKAHGGRLWAENTGDGACVSFTLPAATPSQSGS